MLGGWRRFPGLRAPIARFFDKGDRSNEYRPGETAARLLGMLRGCWMRFNRVADFSSRSKVGSASSTSGTMRDFGAAYSVTEPDDPIMFYRFEAESSAAGRVDKACSVARAANLAENGRDEIGLPVTG